MRMKKIAQLPKQIEYKGQSFLQVDFTDKREPIKLVNSSLKKILQKDNEVISF
jgi:hypothetical protein